VNEAELFVPYSMDGTSLPRDLSHSPILEAGQRRAPGGTPQKKWGDTRGRSLSNSGPSLRWIRLDCR
jgi:hypothetical protein